MKLSFKRVEFVFATAILLYVSVYYLKHAFFRTDINRFDVYFLPEVSRPIILYFAFLYMNNVVIPRYHKKPDLMKLVLYSTLVFLSVSLLFYVADFQQSHGFSLVNSASQVLLCFGVLFTYTEIKNLIKMYAGSSTQYNHVLKKVLPKLLIACSIWLIVVLLFFYLQPGSPYLQIIAAFWIILVPYGYLFFILCLYFLIPSYRKSETPFSFFLLKTVFRSFLLFIPFGILFLINRAVRVSQEEMLIFLWIIVVLIILPLAWYIYKTNRERIEKLISLEIALEASSSKLQFLRSQINPHFLFNSLNTLYSSALQEKSEHTAQGIQKLGDMMRFILHENNQEKIQLFREIEYIRNYIDLQSMRVRAFPNLLIETDIHDAPEDKYIAPMLLIPFIENAFKHGISIAHQSWIKIKLHSNSYRVIFEVSNSVHPKSGTDTERDKSGIGLENVKQRLALLYPDNYELVIKDTPEEFFIHLNITL